MYRCAVAGGLLLLTEMKWKWFSLALFPTGTEFFLSKETIALCPAAETALLSQYKTCLWPVAQALSLLPPEHFSSGRSKSENSTVSIEI